MADVKISELPAGDAVAGADVFPAVQSSATKKPTATQIQTFVYSLMTTRGDIIYRNATVASRLAIGAANTFLGSDGTDPSWRTAAQVRTSLGLDAFTFGTTGDFTATSTDAGAAGPITDLYHNSGSPAANDIPGVFRVSGKNTTPAKVTLSEVETIYDVTTPAGEFARLRFKTMQGGSVAVRGTIGSGLVMGAATGGDKGTGTGNFTAAYDDNVLLTDYVFDAFLGGRKPRYSVRVKAAAAKLEKAWFDPAKYAAFWKKNRRLPGMPDLDDCIDGIVKEKSLGAMIQLLWQTVELQAIHIDNLNRRLEAIEKC